MVPMPTAHTPRMQGVVSERKGPGHGDSHIREVGYGSAASKKSLHLTQSK
jgi:hypothetical protein